MSTSKSKGRNSTALRRLMKEYQQFINDPPDGISAGPTNEEYVLCGFMN